MKNCLDEKFWLMFCKIMGLLLLMGGTLSAQVPAEKSDQSFKQTNDAATLEEKIKIYNHDFCPPQIPLTEISDLSLLKLVTVGLIAREDISGFCHMQLVNGRVVSQRTGSNLAGELDAVCEEIKNKNTRGRSAGNKKPERVTKLKSRKVTYRDRDSQLREMEIYSPPKLQTKKKKKVKNLKGRKVKDYATSKLLPKNVAKEDAGDFSGMPSADAWIDND